MTDCMEALIKKLYYDPVFGFNAQRVYLETKKQYPKVTHKFVNAIIHKQELPALFAKPNYTYKRHYLVKAPLQQWQMDTLFIQLKYNKGKRIRKMDLSWDQMKKRLEKIIMCVDVFTKKVMVRKVNSTSAANATKALKEMINEAGAAPKTIYTDKGGEFRGEFARYCKKKNIKLIQAVKLAPIAERNIRSYKELAFKFKEAFKHNITDYIQDIADNMNSRISRPIKKTPNQATTDGKHLETYNNLKKYLGDNTDDKHIRVGDEVRVLMFRKNALAKGYVAKWTKETFKVMKHSPNGVYTLNKRYGDARYNANYIRKVSGTEPPPPKSIKPGGEMERWLKMQKASRKDYSGRVEGRVTRGKGVKPPKKVPKPKQGRRKRMDRVLVGDIINIKALNDDDDEVTLEAEVMAWHSKKTAKKGDKAGWLLEFRTKGHRGDREIYTNKELELYMSKRTRPVSQKQKFKVGTKVSKTFNGEKFYGVVKSFNKETGWYSILYGDGDHEDMNEQEVNKYKK